ncbi:hypothetical protein PRIPAC_88092 [Pristionchus pacificus]|uniref:Uncharacterized protein n=1 Tax=Pristionchus pacificus TaxID=54126 RepID=A0A2A6B3M0_PRIPA|nr:hypothetical protein PRIPAC_88092 [Pristionchus pacificus]|eukprot:PDM60453.1 hypothetical protein PRIPAC_53431 [Pristionchus pacificus]
MGHNTIKSKKLTGSARLPPRPIHTLLGSNFERARDLSRKAFVDSCAPVEGGEASSLAQIS